MYHIIQDRIRQQFSAAAVVRTIQFGAPTTVADHVASFIRNAWGYVYSYADVSREETEKNGRAFENASFYR